MSVPSSKPKHTLFYGWWVVIACAIIQFYLGGTYYQGFSAIFNPVADEFHWSYALVSLAFTFRGFEAGVMAPLVGILVDRFGTRRLLFTGVCIAALGFWLFSRINSLWSFYVMFLLLAFGLSLGTGIVTMTAVAKWFKGKAGLAMGILTSGFGASGLLMPAIIRLVDSLGWRRAVSLFAIGAAVLCIPLALLVKDPPEEQQVKRETVASTAEKPPPPEITTRAILKTRDFWLLSMSVFFGGLAPQAIIVHQIPYLVSVDISRQSASSLTVIFSLSNIVGRLMFGWLGDKLEKRRCFAISAVIQAAGVLGFALANSFGAFVPSMMLLGLGFGGLIPLRPALQVEFFGMKSFATIQGLLMISVTIGSILSPLFAGWMFDLIHNYRPAFMALGVTSLMAIPVVLASHRRRSGYVTAL